MLSLIHISLGQGADLSRAFTTNMDSFISKITQKAKIIENEEGAKAAAVTEIADKAEEKMCIRDRIIQVLIF